MKTRTKFAAAGSAATVGAFGAALGIAIGVGSAYAQRQHLRALRNHSQLPPWDWQP
jgi:hypothetical protein